MGVTIFVCVQTNIGQISARIKFESTRLISAFTSTFVPVMTHLKTDIAKKLAKNYSDIVLIAGRYEGIDARVKKILKAEETSGSNPCGNGF